MRNTITTLWITGLLMATVTLHADFEKSGGTPADYAAIDAIVDLWQQAYKSKDLGVLTDLYTADGWIMARRSPAMRGRDRIHDFFAGVSEKSEVAINFEMEEIHVIGDYAWSVALFAITYQPVAGGEPTYDSGRAFILYQKGEDGKWRIHRDIDTPTPDSDRLTSPVID